MRKLKFIIIIIIALNSFVLPCLAITQQELIGILSTADDKYSSIHAYQVGLNNLEQLVNILVLPSGNPVARHAAFTCLSKATHNGLFPKNRFFSIMFDQIKNIQVYSSKDYADSDLFMISNMVAYFSFFPKENTGCSVEENFSNGLKILNSLLDNNLIQNSGVKNSLAVKYRNSLKSLKKGNITSAVNILEATKKEINSQSGKGIETQSAKILLQYTSNLISHINSN
jgi:hypothetical protein